MLNQAELQKELRALFGDNMRSDVGVAESEE